MDAGADIVELDVRPTADGGLVVTHDPTLAAAPEGGVAVAHLTLAEIKRLRPTIPALDEVLELLRGRAALEVEIKNVSHEAGYEPAGAGIARGVVAALHRHRFSDAFVASFDPDCLRSVEELDRDMATGLLVEPSADLDRALETAAGRHAFLLPEASALAKAGRVFVERAHERDIRICTWTADDELAIERLFKLGADAVETNDPALGVMVRNRIGLL